MADEFKDVIKEELRRLKEFDKDLREVIEGHRPLISSPEIAFVLLQIATMIVLDTCPIKQKALEFIKRSIHTSVNIYDEIVQDTEVDIEE